MKSDLVSVATSVYNTPTEYLRASVGAILAQTHDNLELLLVDDCSRPETHEVLREIQASDKRVRLIVNEENLGLTKSLNRAIAQAQGAYVARMDADDLCAPNRFEEQIKYLERHREISILGTEYYELRGGKLVKPRRYPNQSWQIQGRLLFGCQGILHPSVMFRAELFTRDGLRYDDDFRIAQDFELWTRAGRQYNIYVLPQYLTTYRISEAQVSVAKRDKQIEYRNAVLFKELGYLGIEPTEEEKELHVAFCHGKRVRSIAELRKWTKRLVDANAERMLFHPVAFEFYARKREFDSAFHTAAQSGFSVANYAATAAIAREAAKVARTFKKLSDAMKKNYD